MANLSLTCCAAAVMLWAPACMARTPFVTGSQLASACTAHAQIPISDCDGYIGGAIDALDDNADYRKTICLPEGTKLSALREAVAKFVPLHPDAAKGTGMALLLAGLKSSFACQPK